MAAGITYDLVETGPATTRIWNSGKDKNLSGFKSVNCEEFGDERLMVAFKGFREPSLNLDNFVTELSATCRRFGPNQGWVPYGVADLPPKDNTKQLFTAKHRDGGVKTEVQVGGNGNFIPNGVHLEVNTNEYVKDFKIIYQVSFPTGLGGSVQYTGGMTGLSGNGKEESVDLNCPTDFALTGTNVKYSTDNGKIRVFQIECRQLVHRPITASSVTYATQGHPFQALKTKSGDVLVSISADPFGVQVFAPNRTTTESLDLQKIVEKIPGYEEKTGNEITPSGPPLKSSCVKTIPTSGPEVANMRFDPKGPNIAIGIGNPGVAFYAINDVVDCKSSAMGITVAQGDDGPGTLDVAFTPDGEYAFVLNEYGKANGVSVPNQSGSVGVVKIDRDTSGHITSRTHLLGQIATAGSTMAGMKLSPDGGRLYVSAQVSSNVKPPPGNTNPILFDEDRCLQDPKRPTMSTGLLTVIDVAKAKTKQDSSAIISTVAAGCSPTRIVVTTDGKTLWTSARGDNRVLAFNTALLESDPSKALLGYASTGGDAPVGLALLHNERFLAVANSNRWLYKTGVGKTNMTILSVANPVAAEVVLTISTGNFPRELIVDSDDSTLYLTNHDTNTLQVIRTAVH
jgi:DNA-binding beta-propeller fold protein YncE